MALSQGQVQQQASMSVMKQQWEMLEQQGKCHGRNISILKKG